MLQVQESEEDIYLQAMIAYIQDYVRSAGLEAGLEG